MDALGRSTGSLDPTRARPRAAPLTVPSATRPARWRCGYSSHQLLDPLGVLLLSQLHSTALPSPNRYEERYRAATYGSLPPLPQSCTGDVKEPPVVDRRFLHSEFSAYSSWIGRADERTRTAYPCSLRV